MTTAEDLGRDFDHTNPEHSKDLRSRYQHLRDRCPIARSEQHGGFWIVSRYSAIAEGLQNHRIFSSESLSIPPMAKPVPGLPIEADEPEHADYRRILWPFLTPKAVRGYEQPIRRMVDELIDDFIEDGHADIVQQLAVPVPAQVVALLFGFTRDEGARCYALLETMMRLAVSEPAAANAAAVEFFTFLQSVIDAARRRPGDDLISTVVAAEVNGRPMTNDECLGLIFTTIGGALETTVSALGSAVYLLGRDADSRQRLVDEPGLIGAAVEEILRAESPVQNLARTVKTECTFHGVTMRQGDRVLFLNGSGNYDEAEFANPERFFIDRPNNRHLAFGHGIHKCEGQHLARLEIRIVIEQVLARLPDYQVASDVSYSFRGGLAWELDSLPIVFAPGKRQDQPHRTL